MAERPKPQEGPAPFLGLNETPPPGTQADRRQALVDDKTYAIQTATALRQILQDAINAVPGETWVGLHTKGLRSTLAVCCGLLGDVATLAQQK